MNRPPNGRVASWLVVHVIGQGNFPAPFVFGLRKHLLPLSRSRCIAVLSVQARPLPAHQTSHGRLDPFPGPPSNDKNTSESAESAARRPRAGRASSRTPGGKCTPVRGGRRSALQCEFASFPALWKLVENLDQTVTQGTKAFICISSMRDAPAVWPGCSTIRGPRFCSA